MLALPKLPSGYTRGALGFLKNPTQKEDMIQR